MLDNKADYARRRGQIRDIVFRHIQFFPKQGSDLPPSLFIGYDDQHAIENVIFDGGSVDNKPLTAWPESTITTREARNIRFLD